MNQPLWVKYKCQIEQGGNMKSSDCMGKLVFAEELRSANWVGVGGKVFRVLLMSVDLSFPNPGNTIYINLQPTSVFFSVAWF